MVNYVMGNVFKSKDPVLVHGCNCFNTFGAGIALQVLRMYPDAYYQADQQTKLGDIGKLGTYTTWSGTHFFYPTQLITIVNAYTQFRANPKVIQLDYDALQLVMYEIHRAFGEVPISIPRIGAGLAGGNWEKIKDILHEEFDESGNLTVYTL